MADEPFVPTLDQLSAGRPRVGSAEYSDGLDLGKRIKLLTSINPYLADDPNALISMAQMPMSIDQLLSQSGQMFGMQTGDKFATRLRNMPPTTQRSVWGTLPRDRQLALQQMGYSPPKTDEESLLGKALGPLDEIASFALQPVARIGRPVGREVLEGLTWIGDRPAHLYRTIRTMGEGGQAIGLGGMVLGGIAAAAAPFTAGGSLVALGAIGLGAVAGGTAAAAITNPNDWLRAFKNTYHGEKAFDRPSQQKITALLGDPRLTGLADDLANFDGFNMRDLIYEMAGMRDTSENSQFGRLADMAAKIAGVGTREYEQAWQALANVVQDPTFQQAVEILQDGKISVGRDFADVVLGVLPGDQSVDGNLHRVLSGVADAAWAVAVDPTLMLGKINQWNEARRFGVSLVNGATDDAVSEFLRVAAQPEVRQYHEQFIDVVRTGSIAKLNTVTPEMKRGYMPFLEHLSAHNIDRANASVEDLHKWYTGSAALGEILSDTNRLQPLMEGIGTVRGQKGIVLAHVSKSSSVYRDIAGKARAFTNGLADPRLEKHLIELISTATKNGEDWLAPGLDGSKMVIPGLSDVVVDETTGKLVRTGTIDHETAYAVGRALGVARPFSKLGNVITSMTTMVPAGRSIALVGDQAVQDVKTLTELGRYMGMPSWARAAWADTILASDSPATRIRTIHGWLDNAMTIAGAKSTDAGREMVETYLQKAMQSYGVDNEVLVNGNRMSVGLFANDMADEIVMPSLHELHKAAAMGHMGKLLGIADAPIIDTAVTRIWKPAVLLRIGFISRAAGEEMLNFMFRGGFGGLVQEFGARSVAHRQTYQAALSKSRTDIALLTAGEKAALALGQHGYLPAHIRPVARMMERFEFQEPVFKMLDNYGRVVNKWLTQGIPLARSAQTPVAKLLTAIAGGTPDQLVVKAASTSDSLVVRTVYDTYKDARLNVAKNMQTLFLGNPKNWRRMAMGGVDNGLIDAARAMQSGWADHIMRDVSTLSAGPLDPGFDQARAQTTDVDGWFGKRRTQYSMPVRGEMGMFHESQQEFAGVLHHNMQHVIYDPVSLPAIERHVSRIRSGVTIEDDVYDELIDGWDNVSTEVGELFRNEAMSGMPREEMIRGAIREMQRIDRGLHDYVSTFVAHDGDIGIVDVAGAIRAWRATPDAISRFPLDYLERMIEDVDHLVAMSNRMGALDDATRTWVAQSLRLGTGQAMRESTALHTSLVDQSRIHLEGVQTQRAAFESTNMALADIQAEAVRSRTAAQQRVDGAKMVYGVLVQRAGDVPFAKFQQQTRLYQQAMRDLQAWDDRIVALGRSQADTMDLMAEATENIRLVMAQHDDLVAAAPKWHTSWSEAEEDMIRTIAAEQLNTFRQEQSAKSIRMENTDLPFRAGQVMVWEMPDRALLPDLSFEQLVVRSTDREVLMANEDTVRRWLDEDLTARGELTAGQAVTANKELADALFVVYRPVIGDMQQELARALPMPRRILRGRIEGDGTVVPLSKNAADETQLWRVDRDLFTDFRPAPVDPETALVAKAEAQAREIVGRMRQWMTKDTRFTLRANTRPLATQPDMAAWDAIDTRLAEIDSRVATLRANNPLMSDLLDEQAKLQRKLKRLGDPNQTTKYTPEQWDAIEQRLAAIDGELKNANTIDAEAIVLRREKDELVEQQRTLGKRPDTFEPKVFRRDEVTGELIGIPPDQPISDIGEFFDANNQIVRTSDRHYFNEGTVQTGEAGEVMWAAIGPMLEDIADNLSGATRFKPKFDLTLKPGQIVRPVDRTPLSRSVVEHISRIDRGLPNYVTGPKFEIVSDTPWDRFVRFGFDKVIGPSIDAIARRPMAFHFFAERYEFSKKAAMALQDPKLVASMADIAQRVTIAQSDNIMDLDQLADRIRILARHTSTDPNALKWSDHEAMSWLRSHSEADLTQMLDGAVLRADAHLNAATGTLVTTADTDMKQLRITAQQLRSKDPRELLQVYTPNLDGNQLLAEVKFRLPQGALTSRERLARDNVQKAIDFDPLLSRLSKDDWDVMLAAETNYNYIHEAAGEYAATFAINDMLPFIDSHEFKTQFAEMGKGFLPFWYAEENFLKRWARTAIDQGPLSSIRKAQLGYMGLKQAGVIRSDEQGRDFFVYPGSTLLIEAVSKIMPGAELPIGAMFQTPTDRILPGITADRTGQPSVSPLVSIPMTFLTNRVPELAPTSRVILGDYAASQNALAGLVPTTFSRFFTAFTANAESSTKYASAMTSAIAQLGASGQGLPDNATAGQIDEYLRKVANHARIILVSQAIMGFFVPGPPQVVNAGEDQIMGFGIEDARGKISDLYQTFIQNLGIEQGTIEFLETYPMANLHHIAAMTEDGIHPVMALTEGFTQSRSGAPLPATVPATEFYTRHQKFMQDSPFAGPWLLPNDGNGERSQYAYDQQTINDLRVRETPEDFLRSIKFKEAAGPYFSGRTNYLNQVSQAEAAGDMDKVAMLKQQWDIFAATWKMSHPVFKDELESSEGRVRRATTITEMRRVINDPDVPRPPHFDYIDRLTRSYDNYKMRLAVLSEDRTTDGKARIEALKSRYTTFMDDLANQHPTARSFWQGVLRPESSLE